MSIGDKLRAIDQHAGQPSPVPSNEPSKKEPAEGPRETGAGITNRPPGEEQPNRTRAPRRGKAKEKGNA